MLVQLDLCVDTGGTDTMSRVLRQSSSAATRVQMLIDAMEIYGRGSSGQGCAAPAVQAAANHIMAAANNATAATAPKRAAQDDESGASHHKCVACIVRVHSWPLVLCSPLCCVLTVQDRAGTATFASMSKYGAAACLGVRTRPVCVGSVAIVCSQTSAKTRRTWYPHSRAVRHSL